VRRIFDMSAGGAGVKAIATALNDNHAPCPRAQQGRPCGWAPSSVREVLYRELYRGVVVWNKTRKRNQWGQKHQQPRPESEWLRTDVPHLRIVSDDAWNAAHTRLAAARKTYMRGTDGQLWGRPPAGTHAKYLLTGIARCRVCGGGVIVRSRDHGRKRSFRYGCYCYHVKGKTICNNRFEVPLDIADQAVFEAVRQDVLTSARSRRRFVTA
jgi:site-specific DNA recombinase